MDINLRGGHVVRFLRTRRIKQLATASWIVLLVVSAAAAAKATFTTTWKAPGAERVGYAGKKVVGLVVSDDLSLRMSAEEALARELTARGVEGIAGYRVIPREEIRDANGARGWFERAGTAGVVMMRLVDLSKEKMPSAIVWQSGTYYGSLWSYYPYAWGATFDITPARTNVKVVIETLVFDVGSNRLLWAGTSESTNPENAQALVKSIVDSAADRMRKDGLMRRK
jgi:hypothetical protein